MPTKGCQIGYEVMQIDSPSSGVPWERIRSVVFVSKKAARSFQRSNPGSKLRAVEMCVTSGKVKRTGKGRF